MPSNAKSKTQQGAFANRVANLPKSTQTCEPPDAAAQLRDLLHNPVCSIRRSEILCGLYFQKHLTNKGSQFIMLAVVTLLWRAASELEARKVLVPVAGLVTQS